MRRASLFLKYVVLFVGLVTGVLVINAALDLYLVYQENRRATIEVQQEKAEAAAQRIESFIREIERQVGWVTQAQWAMLPVDQRRLDYARLLRQVPAITELVQLDRQGREQLTYSRLSMNVIGSGIDRSTEAAFKEAMAHRVWFGPVYFRNESEPYMTMAVAHGGKSGVTVAEVNLKLIRDVVTQIKVGKDGYAYVVDRQGRLVAHPDISLVLRRTDMARLAQVAAALKPQGAPAAPVDAVNLAGTSVLSAYAPIPALGWLVFVEMPTAEAQQPVFDAGLRTLALLVLGLLIAAGAGALLARRMVVPIRAMQAGAERIGGGDLGHRLSVTTGDELEALANQFNRSAEALQQSHETLEQRVEDRTRELSESLEQQTATAEILRAISESPTDVQPVLDAVVKAAVRFCGATDAVIILRAGEGAIFAAHEGPMVTVLGSSLPVNRETAPGRAILDGRTCHLPEIASLDPVEFAAAHRIAGAHGFRASLAAPLLHKSTTIGSVTLRKPEVGPFTPRQIELLETFAAQAVIAIENVRLFNELQAQNQAVTESLEQQTATADILRVISQSPTDVQPVLDAIASSAVRLCDGLHCALFRYDGALQHLAAHYGVEVETVAALRGRYPRAPMRATVTGRALLDGTVVNVSDIVGDAAFPESQRITATAGYRAALAVPMMRDGEPIGVIFVVHREPDAFGDKQVQLLETFAAQAVIAIENVRLFKEIESRNSELRESLEYQTAISDVLKEMSRSTFDLEPLLLTVIEMAANLCRAQMAGVFQLEADGAFRWKAGYALDPRYQEHEKTTPIYPGEDTLVGRVALRGMPVTELDALADPAYGPRDIAEIGQVRSMLGVPMVRDGKLFGVMCLARTRVEAFTDKQVELVTVFADQAVIAIENVRLFTELRESLEQQTATADILHIISSSPGNVTVVFEAILEKAMLLCQADCGVFNTFDGEFIRTAATRGLPQAFAEYRRANPYSQARGTTPARLIAGEPFVHIDDALGDEAYKAGDVNRRVIADLGGARTILNVPLRKDGALLGVIIVYRKEVRPFTGQQIQLLQGFASQAVIAMENARLMAEQSEALEQQTATADVLKVISRSAFDLHTVLDTLLRSAGRLCEADHGTIAQRRGDEFFRSVTFGYAPAFLDLVKDMPVTAERTTGTGRALLDGRIHHIPDVLADPEYQWKEAQEMGGFRTMLGVPMLREGEPVGVLTLTRAEVRPFTDKQIELVATFADQAAIAIENVRLFREIQDKSRQLEIASQHKSQFLANMSHELRTPLNAIIGYTEMMADGLYGDVPEKAQAVLERVQANGRHLLGLINDVLDLSKIEAGQLALAVERYSVADMVATVLSATESLARTKGLTLGSDVAAGLPTGTGDSRRLTQVLLNLVGNAIKFTDQGSVEVRARQVGERFELAVVDSGFGIAPEDQAKIFEEFQQVDSTSTRKKGGTGLGLSISRRIVELHGGRITVQSEVGKGSTFTVSVPVHVAAPIKEAAQ